MNKIHIQIERQIRLHLDPKIKRKKAAGTAISKHLSGVHYYLARYPL